MISRSFVIATLCCAVWLAAGATEAAVVTSDDGDRNGQDALTLRDRPLDEFAALARSSAFDVRPQSDFIDNYADDIGDGLFFAPGVSVNALDLQEPRIVIRGFGLANIHQRSTVTVLRDGAPITDVHGAANTSEIDLLSVDRIEILRGGGSLRPGPDNLGGVVNLVSRRGENTPSGATARFEGGATVDGRPGGQAHMAVAGGSKESTLDYYASLTGLYELGFRENNRRSSGQFHGNLGIKPGDNFATRFFLDVVNSKTDLAGGLAPADAADDPQAATPPIQLGPLFPGGPIIELADGAIEDDFSRDILEARIANQTNFSLFGHDFELGGHYARREVESPQIDFVGFIDESGGEWGARLEVERSLQLFGGDALYRFGGGYATGSQTSDRFENESGAKGDVLARTDQRSKQINAFVEGVYWPLQMLAVDIGAKFITTERAVTDLADDDLDRRDFTGVAARLGLLAKVAKAVQAFANVSRGYEPPSLNELIAGDPTSLNGLDEQDTFTLEAGLRGALGDRLAWDVVYFNTEVENEIINIGDTASLVDAAILVNVDKTKHKGVEAAIDLPLLPRYFARRGAALTLRNVYHYSDFRFTDADPLGPIDGNRLAGTPTHLYRGELRYDDADEWFFAINVQLAGGDYFADHVNEVSVPTEAVIGFSAGLQLKDQVHVFVSGENITNRAYVAGVTPVLSQNDANARIFALGARASVYGGLAFRF